MHAATYASPLGDVKRQYGPRPSMKPHAPETDAEHFWQSPPGAHGVHGAASVHSLPWLAPQSRREPTGLPPLAEPTHARRGKDAPLGASARAVTAALST